MSSGVPTGRRYRWFPSVAVFVLVILVATGCAFPRDPRGTLEGVRNDTMRVGIVGNDPWARMEEGHVSGVEVELLKDFARELGAETSFVPGTTPELLEAARQGEVDVLIGGFTSTSPGVSEGKEAGVTGTYLTTRFLVGVPPGSPAFDDPSGREIAVGRIDGTAALLKEEGAVPVAVGDLSTAEMPVLISLDITKDGVSNLRRAVVDLMDQTPTTVDHDDADPLRGELAPMLRDLDWVEDVDLRLREEGQVYFGEALVVPSDETGITAKVEDALKRARDLDWRIHDLALTPVRELPEKDRSAR